ncbi:MAG: HU family DNA-binding protein [Chloroflexota bacterium]
MNRTELANEIARRTTSTRRNFSRDDVNHMLDIMLDIFEDQLTRPDGEIRLGDLGVLGVQRRVRSGEAGQLRNIQTGEAMRTPRISFYIRFQPTLTLKKKLKARRAEWKYLDD